MHVFEEAETSVKPDVRHEDGIASLLRTTERFADRLATEPDTAGSGAPLAELRELAGLGLLTAPLPTDAGGLGLGTEPGGHLPLLRLLASVGGADLALGRIYEGHVNGLILVANFGTAEQLRRAAADAAAGKLFGVWNTGHCEPMSVTQSPGNAGGLQLRGCKGFATGAAFVERPIVTAEHGGWQMTLPRMDTDAVAHTLSIDRSSWQPLGMERSESYTVDFTGVPLQSGDLIGQPGDFYRDPLFRGGAVRFAAVQAGALLRLASLFSQWLADRGRGADPYQLARMGEVTLAAQEAVLWIERAAAVAERSLWPDATEYAAREMIQTANMTRLAVERLATATMPRVIAGVGAHGLLRPSRFERLIRDLTMYLRQPNPDGTLAEVGRCALRQRSSGELVGSLWQKSGDI